MFPCTEEDTAKNIIITSSNKSDDEYNNEADEKLYSIHTTVGVEYLGYFNNAKSKVQSTMKFIRRYSKQPNQAIIFTASDALGTYNSVFKHNYWRAVYLGKNVVKLINNGTIKYFCLYQSKPKQYIEEYAEIVRINFITNGPDAGKYEFILKNITRLPQNIHIGTINPVSIMRGRRTTLNKLLSSTIVNQL